MPGAVATLAILSGGEPNTCIGVWIAPLGYDPDSLPAIWAAEAVAWPPDSEWVDITAYTEEFPGMAWTFDGRGWTQPVATTNGTALGEKVLAAIATNQTYQALGTPTAAQVAAQVAALTRQVNALIRLQTAHLSSTAGT